MVMGANISTPPKCFGAWESKAVNTVYQAAMDGFVVAWAMIFSDVYLFGYTDGLAVPLTSIAIANDNGGDHAYGTIMFPVKRNDYWKVTVASGSPTIRWIPFK
jgi:hypothetical protein